MFIRHSTNYCPFCNAEFWVDAGIFADDHQYRCNNCGTIINIKMRFGKIVSVSAAPVVSDEYKGYGGTNTPQLTHDEEVCGNIEYWKANYGVNWQQAHDYWTKQDDEWWRRQQL